MSDILSTLKNNKKIYGIFILLKLNCARLTLTFHYCVKELLTHFYYNAMCIIVFGFKNARISNYIPSNTFKPLATLPKGYSSVRIGLSNYTVYYFDLEGFCFLAAY